MVLRVQFGFILETNLGGFLSIVSVTSVILLSYFGSYTFDIYIFL